MLGISKFDKEYSTQFKHEVEHLKACGIYYTFVKTIDNISTYKFTKSKALFEALALFYERLEGK